MPRLSSVTPRLPVADLQRTIDFYTNSLGFRVDVLWPEQSSTFVIVARDTTQLGFFVPNEHQPGEIGYAELYIQTVGVVDMHRGLQSLMPIEWGPEVYAYGRREFAVRDPSGYLVIFTEATDDPPTTHEPGE